MASVMPVTYIAPREVYAPAGALVADQVLELQANVRLEADAEAAELFDATSQLQQELLQAERDQAASGGTGRGSVAVAGLGSAIGSTELSRRGQEGRRYASLCELGER